MAAVADHDHDRDNDPHDLHRFLYQPIAKDYPHAPSSREDRLKTIIANIDRRHAAIHAAIIQDAKRQLEHELQNPRSEADPPKSAEDPSAIDDNDDDDQPPPDNPNTLPPAPPRKRLPRPPMTAAQQASHAAALEALYANLATPWDAARMRGDPCLPPLARPSLMPPEPHQHHQNNSTTFPLPPAPADIVQATPGPEVRHAAAARERIAAYEDAARGARFGREGYVLALGRVQQQQQQQQQQPPQQPQQPQAGAGGAAPPAMTTSTADPRRRSSGGNNGGVRVMVQQQYHHQPHILQHQHQQIPPQIPQQAYMVVSPAADAPPAPNASTRDPRLLARQNSAPSASSMDPRARGR